MSSETPHSDDIDPVQLYLSEVNRRMGMKLFLASLTVLFVVSIVAYLIIFFSRPEDAQIDNIGLPRGLWASTVALLGAGLTMYAADYSARRGQMQDLRKWLLRCYGLTVVFLAIQTPCMIELLAVHNVALDRQFISNNGLIFALIIVHALHVIGGMAPLSVLAYRILRHRLRWEQVPAVHSCAIYWHFLEGVWVVLFGLLLLTA